MKYNETIELFKIILSAYPSMQKKGKTEIKRTIDLWHELLGDMSYREVLNRVQDHIKVSSFPPTIADVRGKKTNKFDNFKSRVSMYSEEEIEDIVRKKREEYKRKKGLKRNGKSEMD